MEHLKKIILSLLAGLVLIGSADCGKGGASTVTPKGSAVSSNPSWAEFSETSSAEDNRVPNIPPDSPGPFVVLKKTQPDTLDVYTSGDEEEGAFIISLPYSMLPGFPDAVPQYLPKTTHVYCGSVGNLIWAVLDTPFEGMAFHSICTSTDGGVTWKAGGTDKLNEDDFGGMCMGPTLLRGTSALSASRPTVPITPQGLPERWKGNNLGTDESGHSCGMGKYDTFTPQCPIFTGDFGVIPLMCAEDDIQTNVEYLITTDSGMNWHWEQDDHQPA